MTQYLKTAGRALAVMAVTLGWLVVVPLVDLLSRGTDGAEDELVRGTLVSVPHAEAA